MQPMTTSTTRRSNGHAKLIREELPLHDLDLERVILGSCLITPTLLVDCDLESDDFYSDGHRLIWSALMYLAAEGESVSTWTVQSRLTDLGKLAAVGGAAYLHDLTDKTIPVPPLPTTRVKRLALQRRVRAAAHTLQARIGHKDDLVIEYAELDHAREQLRELDAPKVDTVPSVADRARALRPAGERFPTGFPALDAAMRGGIPKGKVIVVLGAPGASKTNFCTRLLDHWERAGCYAMYLAADEASEMIVVRLGQLAGWNRDALEDENPAVRDGFARAAEGRNYLVVDPSEDRVSLEAAEKLLILKAGDRPRVLVVDSLQTILCEAADGAESPMERVKAVIHTCKRMAARGTIVVAIGEMSRAGYANGDRHKDRSALSAGKETGDVEYAAHVILGLRSVPEHVGQIDVEVAKNRLGRDKPDVRLVLDFDTLAMRETSAPDVDHERRARADSVAARFREAVVSAVRNNPRLRTKDQVCRATGVSRNGSHRALLELLELGYIVFEANSYRVAGGTSV